jgi:hypothetical protein
MIRKRRHFLALVASILITVPSIIVHSAAINEKKENNAKNDQLFVFPSMQMESISASRESHVPVVEVVYRGQPPSGASEVKSTTVSSREVISTSTTPKGKFLNALLV